MSQSDMDYKVLRRRVEKELQQEKLTARWIFFGVSLLMYVIFMAIGWGMFIANTGNVPPAVNVDDLMGSMILASIAGFMPNLFQFISLMLETKAGEREMRNRVTTRILGEEIMRRGLEAELVETPREKAKRMMRLTDDGELEEVIEEEPEPLLRSEKKI